MQGVRTFIADDADITVPAERLNAPDGRGPYVIWEMSAKVLILNLFESYLVIDDTKKYTIRW